MRPWASPTSRGSPRVSQPVMCAPRPTQTPRADQRKLRNARPLRVSLLLLRPAEKATVRYNGTRLRWVEAMLIGRARVRVRFFRSLVSGTGSKNTRTRVAFLIQVGVHNETTQGQIEKRAQPARGNSFPTRTRKRRRKSRIISQLTAIFT